MANCSSITFVTKDNKHLIGRTYDEFGGSENQVLFLPKDYTVFLQNGDTEGIPAKYSVLGMGVINTFRFIGIHTPILTDAMNTNGLMCTVLYYPHFAQYDTNSGAKYQVNPVFFPYFLLAECATVEEVVELLKDVNLTTEKIVEGEDMPLHFMITDKTGESVVIEPDAGGITVHRNSMGVLTNSPNYEWHKTNLRNYINITDTPKNPQIINGYEIEELGEGTGGLGIPGDYTPVSRFVRVAFYKHYSPQPENEIQAVTQMFHVFSAVDIPEGAVKVNDTLSEYTLYMSAMCAESLTYYYSSYENRRITAIDLNKIKDETGVKLFGRSSEQDINYLL